MNKKTHWRVVDSLYAIGIVLVLVGHSHSSDWSKFENTPLYWIILFIYLFHMALFFSISGFLFSNSDSILKEGYIKWISDKAARLLVPYVFWTMFALVPKYYVENHGFQGLDGKYLLRILFYPRENIWGHFWFIPVMFLAYLIFGLLRIITKGKSQKLFIVCAISIAFIFYFLPFNTGFLGFSDLKSMILFFAFGSCIHRFVNSGYYIIFKPWRWVYSVLVILVTCLTINYAHNSRVIGLLTALSIIIVCWILADCLPYTPIVKRLSNYNYTYYIFSWFFQSVVMVLCDLYNLSWYITFFFMFCAGIIGPTVLLLIYERFVFLHKNYIKLILGIR